MPSDKDALEILKTRLAAGEISIAEYRELAAIVGAKGPSEPLPSSLPSPRGKLLAQIDDLQLHETGICVKGKWHPLADVTSVSGSSSSLSINFIPMSKTSSAYFSLATGEHISLDEDRVLLGGTRHKAIRNFYSCLQRLTLQSRLNRLATKLVSEARLQIFQPPTTVRTSPVFLTSDGRVQSGTRNIDLKAAKRTGTFGVGTEARSLSRSSHEYNTAEVVISEEKGLFGYIPLNAIRFTPNVHDSDIVHSLLIWLAAEGNYLVRA